MDPQRLLSLSFLLVLSLAFELSYGTGGDPTECPLILKQLGSDILLPLTSERINKSMSKSIRILVTMATSKRNSTRKKIVSLFPSEESVPRYVGKGYQFHLENMSLRILGGTKKNEGWYYTALEKNVSVQNFCVQLKLYEQVSTPEIKVLSRTQEKNGTCSLTLTCTVKSGDHVAYRWSDGAGTPLLSPANSSHLLNVSLGSQRAASIYTCTVRNPVSNSSQAFDPTNSCGPALSESRPWVLPVGLSGAIASVILIVIVTITLGIKGKANPPVMEDKSLTVYAQVQKPGILQEKPDDDLLTQDPCTTIYVAAEEPVQEPVQKPNPITVYASVTLPES